MPPKSRSAASVVPASAAAAQPVTDGSGAGAAGGSGVAARPESASPPSFVSASVIPARSPTSSEAASAAVTSSGPVSECGICRNAFECEESSERYPRVFPCAHTFCQSCIQSHIQHSAGSELRCMVCRRPVPQPLSDAKQAKPNFALIDLLQKIATDPDHRAVDAQEQGHVEQCSECGGTAEFFCVECDESFCEEDKLKVHAFKALSKHHIISATDERPAKIPKCSKHKTKDLDLWCMQCEVLCCLMCEKFGEHEDHPKQLKPADDVFKLQRNKISELVKQVTDVTHKQLDEEAVAVVERMNAFTASVDRTGEGIRLFAAAVIQAINERAQLMDEEVKKLSSAGIKNMQLRIEEVTVCRSQATMVIEEAKRVLRMNDYAMLKHVSSVVKSANNSERSLAAFKTTYSEPEPLQLLATPDALVDEIAGMVAAHMPMRACEDGKEVPPLPAPKHKSRINELDSCVRELMQRATCQRCRQCWSAEMASGNCHYAGYGAKHTWLLQQQHVPEFLLAYLGAEPQVVAAAAARPR